MIIKRPPLPERLRSRPVYGFGWIDHRFLRDGYLSRTSSPALGLYCLLVCAADRHGLSYYSQERLCSVLAMEAAELASARRELIELGLIAYRKPLYQLLSLEEPPPSPPAIPAIPAPALRRDAGAPAQKTTNPPPQAVAWPSGVNLRAMVEASLREATGGAA